MPAAAQTSGSWRGEESVFLDRLWRERNQEDSRMTPSRWDASFFSRTERGRR